MTAQLNRDAPDDFDMASPLSRAIQTWRSGGRISLTIATKLIAEGYDVPGLERAYANTARLTK